MPRHEDLIACTELWLSSVIIKHTLCPFAKREFDAGTIAYHVIDTLDLREQLHRLIEHCAALDKDTDIETALLIFDGALSDFEDYLDFFSVAEDLLKAQGYEGVYQLASFHPDYCFAGAPAQDAANYTNRSPYPMVHILREASVEPAVRAHPNAAGIPARNIRHMQDMGLDAAQQLLANCYLKGL